MIRVWRLGHKYIECEGNNLPKRYYDEGKAIKVNPINIQSGIEDIGKRVIFVMLSCLATPYSTSNVLIKLIYINSYFLPFDPHKCE